ncbi:hydrolase TatD [Selenomonas sp. oral taxon 920]|uniref:TatD family hydrolase n=1 Tax=Selenomonas sp. oral taxon 920 TaxID=1884263 RepID=UPI000840A921|nr:TatD family hydrolase [Selenomonas sp. oral taxon 920]AOH48792.1 hydrolase TatD [Selenomonas sp. oral taxon 920]
MTTFIDTHAHLYDERYDDDRAEMIARAAAAGVTQIISMGDTMAASAQVVADAEQYPTLYAAVGVHPESACVLTDAERAQLLTWAKHPKVVAIGEIGLDYYWEKDPKVRALQRELFVTQLNLARAAGLPVCIHDREAHGDTLAILQAAGRDLTGVLHCYSGSLETARELWKLGYYIGVDGPLTFKNAGKLPAIVREAPQESLLIETDSPYLAPVPKRGKRNEPAYVVHVAAKIAELRGETVEEVARYTTENARRLYPKLKMG